MSDIDQMLIGTSWVRTGGQHNPKVGKIDRVQDSGPRIKAHDGYYRIAWVELNLTWTPADSRSQKRYDMWLAADHIESLDRKLEKEVATVASKESDLKLEELKECHGAWHRHATKDGPIYDKLPLSAFGIAGHGPNKGRPAAVCRDCNRRNKESPSHQPKSKIAIKKVEIVEPIKIAPEIATPEGTVYRWRILVVQPTEHFVQAKDFLDAAAQVSGLGEIVRVEKL